MKKQQVLAQLREALAGAEMERANFDAFMDTVTLEQGQVTGFIRERTRLYRDSWIIAPLKRAIAEIER